jgi:hypothetical protein
VDGDRAVPAPLAATSIHPAAADRKSLGVVIVADY